MKFLLGIGRAAERASGVPPHREAEHDTAEAENSTHELRGLFSAEGFDDGVADGNDDRFRDLAEQALKHSG